MHTKKLLIPSLLALALIAGSAWTIAVAHPSAPSSLQAPAQTHSASGKVTAVSNESFTLRVQKEKDSEEIVFQTNSNTKVDGKLEVGAEATVEFRVENDKNVAVHVVAQPGS